MRKFVTAIATAATLGLMAASAPAFADHNGNQGNNQQNNQYQNNQYQNNQYDDGDAYQGQGQWNNRGRNFDRRFDFDRQERGFDRWERGWGNQGFHQFRHHRPLSYWQLTRRLEAQGYYGVRGLRKSRFGFGWRAFAFNRRGLPVMLQINPYNGRVLNARVLHAAY